MDVLPWRFIILSILTILSLCVVCFSLSPHLGITCTTRGNWSSFQLVKDDKSGFHKVDL